jgi:hypothetical protein
MWFQRQPLEIRLFAFLAVAIIGMIALSSCGSSSKGSAAETPASEAEIHELADEVEGEEEEAFYECLPAWNGPENVGPRNEVSVLEASYASITLSELYPGKCLVTVANPQLNLAAQYLEVEGGPYTFKDQSSGEATSLPSSVTEWNASVKNGGRLALRP